MKFPMRPTKPKTLREIAGGLTGWVGAGAFAYWFLDKFYDKHVVVSRDDIVNKHAPAFERFQAEQNSRVKENDRNSVNKRELKMSELSRAARTQSGTLDPEVDFMTTLTNSVDEKGNLITVETREARELREWMKEHGDNVDFSEELERAKRENRATLPMKYGETGRK